MPARKLQIAGRAPLREICPKRQGFCWPACLVSLGVVRNPRSYESPTAQGGVETAVYALGMQEASSRPRCLLFTDALLYVLVHSYWRLHYFCECAEPFLLLIQRFESQTPQIHAGAAVHNAGYHVWTAVARDPGRLDYIQILRINTH